MNTAVRESTTAARPHTGGPPEPESVVSESPGHAVVEITSRVEAASRESWLLALALTALYMPVIVEAARIWMSEESYSHGIFILPVSAFLLWIQRSAILSAPRRPARWGLAPFCIGLMLEVFGYLMRISSIEVASMVPVAAGAVLLLGGVHLWRIVRFPICFLIFAAPWPGSLTASLTNWIQNVSTTGAAAVMRFFGYAVLQTGNVIEVPGATLEVAEACSGFKKLIALMAFALLYGYMFRIGWGRRLLLLAAAVPIAVLANVVRVAGLVAVTSAGGVSALNRVHDAAEMAVLVVAFFLFIALGRLVGCRQLRFAL